MCRGIAKKAYTASKRAALDKTAILASVAQALSDAGKMNDSIQNILDTLSSSLTAKNTVTENIKSIEKSVDNIEKQIPSKENAKEIDIKDLNDIDDKMARGIAKKAFIAANRSGEDKVNAISTALSDAGKINEKIKSLLNLYIVSQGSSDHSNNFGSRSIN